jgi:type II secretory pathway pseudopilin PulG
MRPGRPPNRNARATRNAPRRGFTYIALLAIVCIMALALAVAGPTWGDQSRRVHERDLLRIGALYAHAIGEYRADSPGSLKEYPRSLDDLLLDKRFLGMHRHLRQLYPDPLDPSRPWGVIRDIDGYILGVYSQDDRAPVAAGPITLGDIALSPARHYTDWKFVPAQPS